MKIEDVVLINKYGQGLDVIDDLRGFFSDASLIDKRKYLTELNGLIGQSKPVNSDVVVSILGSGLKPTYTPCVLLRKGVTMHNLEKLVQLPEYELNKVFLLLLSLFKVAYQRRYLIEKNHPNKWWYWDLSNPQNIERIQNMMFEKLG